MTRTKPRVLFVCTHNAARSQMAEGIMRYLAGGTVDVQSGGTEPSGVHPLAIRAVKRLFDFDMSDQRSKNLDEFAGQHFDYVITLCDSAKEACPVVPGDPERVHWGFDDPGAVPGSEDDRYDAFRRVAVELERRIRLLLILVQRGPKASTA